MNGYDFLTIWLAWVVWIFQHIDWMVVFGAVLIIASTYVFWKMARAPKSRSSFDFSQMFEGEDRKTSMGKFLGFIGGLTGTWIVVALTASNHLTEGYFVAYLGVLVAGKVASEYVASRKGVAEAAKDTDAGVPA